MPSPSVTYTFANSTTADATQVNQNFSDIINGLTDGTKDLSINALTAAGTATLNGNVTLGNSSSDDITVTGSLSSSIPIKTTNTYDIGSSTLGLRAAFFGANSQTVKLQGSSSMSATWTWTFPTTAGTDGYVLSTNGSGTTSWIKPFLDALSVRNYALSTAVNANALTITFLGGDGNALSSTNKATAIFRNSTATSGTPTEVNITSDLTLTISSGSTLGHTSGADEYIYVYLINNSGTAELAVSSDIFDEGSLVTTTAEGGGGAADSDGVMYSTTARSNVACRLIGRLRSNQVTAGTWAAAMEEVSLIPFEKVYISEVNVNSGNGHGSTNNKIRRFSTIEINRGKDITYADSAGNGASFTINTDGIYSMHYVDSHTAAAIVIGISLNSSQLTTAITGITAADRVINVVANTSADYPCCSATRRLRAGDVIRAHTDGVPTTTTARIRFMIKRVG